MGANAQTSVPTFTAGDVLTAANMNISARTGVPVFSNTTTRDAGFGGTGEKTLAEGQLCYLEDSNIVQYYDGAAWATVGPTTVSSGLTLVKTQTIGSAVSSVQVTSAFSSTYDNYLITVNGGVGSANGYLNLTFGATATGYEGARGEIQFPTGNYSGSTNASTSFVKYVMHDTNNICGIIQVQNPNLAKYTVVQLFATASTGAEFMVGMGILKNTTSYTDFTLTAEAGKTVTGGTIRVYGYANS
jgi:hypothetical protein